MRSVGRKQFIVVFVAGSRSLLRVYIHRSAPVSTKKEILELQPSTKMQRDERPSSYAAVEDRCSRFPSFSYRENGTFLHGLGRSRGSSRDHSAASCLGNSGTAIVVGDHCRRAARQFALLVGLPSRTPWVRRVVPIPAGRCYLFGFWSPTMVRASTLVFLMAARTAMYSLGSGCSKVSERSRLRSVGQQLLQVPVELERCPVCIL